MMQVMPEAHKNPRKVGYAKVNPLVDFARPETPLQRENRVAGRVAAGMGIFAMGLLGVAADVFYHNPNLLNIATDKVFLGLFGQALAAHAPEAVLVGAVTAGLTAGWIYLSNRQ